MALALMGEKEAQTRLSENERDMELFPASHDQYANNARSRRGDPSSTGVVFAFQAHYAESHLSLIAKP